MRKILNVFFHAVFSVAFGVLLIVAALEWAAGCGESWVDAHGVTHIGECIFIPQRSTSQANGTPAKASGEQE